MKYLMFLLNCMAFLLGIANVVYSYFMFRRRYIFALNAMGENDTFPKLGCDPFRTGLKTFGISVALFAVGGIASLFDGLPKEGQNLPIAPAMITALIFAIISITLCSIYKVKTDKLQIPYIIPNNKYREECLFKLSTMLTGFNSLIMISILISSFHMALVVYDFALCFL